MKGYDVLVVGELLVELSSPQPLRQARHFDVSFSGDTLNAAAAASAAGAHVGVVACVGDDDFGEALLDCLSSFELDHSLIRLVDRPNGMYFTGADPAGSEQFIYLRRDSAGSLLAASDLDRSVLRAASAAIVSGVTCAISPTAAEASELAAREVRAGGGFVVYDPNFRARLTTPEAAREAFSRLAPHTYLATPSWPNDARALFDVSNPVDVGALVRTAGPAASLVTLGSDGALLDERGSCVHYPAALAPSIVDATGCGDVLVGTLTARLALGDSLDQAIRLGMAAAALSLGARGGTGRIPSLAESRALAKQSLRSKPAWRGPVGQSAGQHLPTTSMTGGPHHE